MIEIPKYPEKQNCENGEKNFITREVFCNAHNEFCKYIKSCQFKTK